jgi:uncharacterized membrane protein YjgN (DUF898 family)
MLKEVIMKSEFTAGLLELIVTRIVVSLLILITFGIGTPWAVVYFEKWLADRTIIDGKKLTFDGTGGQLFGQYIKWFLLTIITFGIYGLWLSLNMKKWVVEHTHIEVR